MNSIEKHILQLENDLLKSEVRKSAEKVSEILAYNFVEFCSSGCEYHYKYGDKFGEEDDNGVLNWEIVDFRIEKLSEECLLAMYKVIKHNGVNEDRKYSFRSSIWKSYDGKWKLFFHQGTISCKEEVETGKYGE